MRSNIRNLFAAAVVVSVCALSTPAAAQGNSQKAEKAVEKAEKKWDKAVAKRTDRIPTRTARRTYTRSRVLCADGIWVTRTSNACYNRGGLAARQGNYGTTPRASARARERASLNSAVRRGPYVNNISTNAIARCMDGTYWHATTRAGACYRHGGVARWL